MKEISFYINRPVKETHEVEFPIYGQDDTSEEFDSTVTYYRVDFFNGVMRRTDVTVRKIQAFRREVIYTIAVDPNHHFDGSKDMDYLFGRDLYSSNAEEFNEMLGEAIRFSQALLESSCEGSVT